MDFLQDLDNRFHEGLQSLRPPVLDGVVVALTHLGDNLLLLLAAVTGAVLLVRCGRWPSAFVLVLAAVLGMTMVETIKELVHRPRPVLAPHPWIGAPTNPSYPSGHAFNSAAVYLALALMVGRCFSATVRRRLIAAALLLTGVVGLTRLFLGVHYLTDVLGGWAGGVGWCLCGPGWISESRRRFRAEQPLDRRPVCGSMPCGQTQPSRRDIMAALTPLIDNYLAGVKTLRDAVRGMTREQVMARPVAGKWSTLEVVCHLADFDPILADRMKRIIALDNPQLVGADENRFAASLAYHDRDLEEELTIIDTTRRQLARSCASSRIRCSRRPACIVNAAR